MLKINFILFQRDFEQALRQLSALGAPPQDIEDAKVMFEPNALVLGFARRFATYKRPNMLLHNPERLLRILNNKERPVQLILAGKAHPADEPGKAMIQKWMQFIKHPDARSKVTFLSDYNLSLTEKLVQGVDLWINTPRRPWEACGTSGMKVLVNGGLNLSELDGWWAEAYTSEVGWALGDGCEHDSDPAWDADEAEALYDLLENEVIPLYYKRGPDGVPSDWIERIRESMACLTPRYSAIRAVREYTDRYYIPAAKSYKERSIDKNKGEELVFWAHTLKNKWAGIGFRGVNVDLHDDQYHFEVRVNLDGMDSRFVKLELYSMGETAGVPNRLEMNFSGSPEGESDIYLYRVSVPATRPIADYTPCIVPYHPNVSVPLEASEVLWQK